MADFTKELETAQEKFPMGRLVINKETGGIHRVMTPHQVRTQHTGFDQNFNPIYTTGVYCWLTNTSKWTPSKQLKGASKS